MQQILNTKTRKKFRSSRDKAKQNLVDKGWRYDGLWWCSPYTNTRYMLSDAISVEELRKWSGSDSAFLGDRQHSMWTIRQELDYALTTPEEHAEDCRKRQEIKKLGSDSNFGK